MRQLLNIFIILILAHCVSAQDIHWSQFNDNPIFQNPGNAGNFNGDYRFVANYRDQWRSVTVPFTTLSLSADGKLDKHKNLGYGILFFHDVVGDGSLRTINTRTGVKKDITGKGLTYNPDEYGYVILWDLNKKAYRTVNVNTVTTLKGGGEIYKIQENLGKKPLVFQNGGIHLTGEAAWNKWKRWADINRRKRLGISRPKSESTISKKAYSFMKMGFKKKK